MINGNGQVMQQQQVNEYGQVMQQQQVNEYGQVMQQQQQINQQVLQQFIISIKDAIRNKSIDTSSAMKLIVICIEIIENMENMENIEHIENKENIYDKSIIKYCFVNEKVYKGIFPEILVGMIQ